VASLGPWVPESMPLTNSVGIARCCLHGCNSPADGESDLNVSLCALYILLVGNEFTNPLSMENRAFPLAEQMGEKAF
jgi:hypothetical protein